jgi:hypothetical protein
LAHPRAGDSCTAATCIRSLKARLRRRARRQETSSLSALLARAATQTSPMLAALPCAIVFRWLSALGTHFRPRPCEAQ